MTSTINLALPEIAESQASKAITHNEALHFLDALVQCGAIDRDLTAPPGSPVDGNVYIPKATATGAWAGKENQLAHYDVNTWKFYPPEEGWRCYVRDEDSLLVYTGSAWTVLAGGSANPPFVDSTALAKGSSDATKLVRLEVDGLTTGTTRVLTVQDRNYTLAGTDDVAAAAATGASDLAAHVAASDPHTGYQKESEKAAANGYASLDSGTLVPAAQLPAMVGDSGSGGTKGAVPAPAAGDAAAAKFLKADGTWGVASSVSALPDFLEAKNTTSPNATVPVVSLTATSSESNIDVAIKPKGDGALTRWIADGTTAGGNKRGANATDWGVTGLNATWVASGDYSTIGGGRYNQASTTYSTVAGGYNNLASTNTHTSIGGGESNVASGAHAVVSGGKANSASAQYASVGGGNGNQATVARARVGGGNGNTATATATTVGGGETNAATANYATVAGGVTNTASGAQSVVGGGESNTASGIGSVIPGGKEVTTRGIEGLLAFGSGKIGTLGDAQYGKYVIRRATTDATPSALTTTGAAASTTNGVILPNNSTYSFKGLVSARNTANGDSSGWEFTGVIKRGANAAATALVAAVTPTLIAQDSGASTWVLAVTADTTNGGLSVTVTGVAATTIRWVANIDTVEVTN